MLESEESHVLLDLSAAASRRAEARALVCVYRQRGVTQRGAARGRGGLEASGHVDTPKPEGTLFNTDIQLSSLSRLLPGEPLNSFLLYELQRCTGTAGRWSSSHIRPGNDPTSETSEHPTTAEPKPGKQPSCAPEELTG